MLRRYDHIEIMMEEELLRERILDSKLTVFARDFMENLHITDSDEIYDSMKRAFRTCINSNIPLHENFRQVYRFDGENLIIDWKISSLASCLIAINCDPKHESVAKTQLYFALKHIS